MRIPKVGEKWKRWDGKPNGVTVIQVVPPGTSAPSTQAANTHIHYRYDDGVQSDKPLPEFRQKFKDPVEHGAQCSELHPVTGVRCLEVKDHVGPHSNGSQEWLRKAIPRENPADKPSRLSDAPIPLSPMPSTTSLARREQIKAYYGYDPAESSALTQKQGDWNDPEYRRKYNGFK